MESDKPEWFFPERYRLLLKLSAIVFSMLLLVSAPIIVGGTHYIDDYYRIINGDAAYWLRNGRPLTTWLIQFFSFSTVITDNSPFILIAGLAALSGTLVLSFSRITGEQPKAIIYLSLIVALCPFMVQPMLYVYDALPILLAIGLSFFACIRVSPYPIKQITFSFLMFICAMCFYQTTVNHSLINVLFLCMLALSKRADESTEQVKSAALVGISLLVAMLVYRAIVVPYYVIDEFNKARGAMLPFTGSNMAHILNNVKELLGSIRDAFPGFSMLPVITLTVAGTIACWVIGVRQFKTHKRRLSQIVYALFCFAAPIAAGVFTVGFLIMMNWLSADPRVLTAFSSGLVFYFYLACITFPRIRAGLVLMLFIYLWSSAVFMVSAFRAMANQTEFDEGLAINLRGDLSRMSKEAIDRIIIIGHSPIAPAAKPVFRNYPLIKRIIFPAMAENNTFHYYALVGRFMVYTPIGETTDFIRSYAPAEVFSSNCMYSLYQYKQVAILNFKAPYCKTPEESDFPLLRTDY